MILAVYRFFCTCSVADDDGSKVGNNRGAGRRKKAKEKEKKREKKWGRRQVPAPLPCR